MEEFLDKEFKRRAVQQCPWQLCKLTGSRDTSKILTFEALPAVKPPQQSRYKRRSVHPLRSSLLRALTLNRKAKLPETVRYQKPDGYQKVLQIYSLSSSYLSCKRRIDRLPVRSLMWVKTFSPWELLAVPLTTR